MPEKEAADEEPWKRWAGLMQGYAEEEWGFGCGAKVEMK